MQKKANLDKISGTFLQKIATKAQCPHLLQLLDTSNKVLLDAYKKEHTVIDILEKYPNTLSSQELCDLLLPLLPRYYSIASSQKKYPREIHLTVAHVQYELNNKKRVGLGSDYLCNRMPLGSQIVYSIHPSSKFTLPNEDLPIIMVGPGTGVAPFRAFLQERQALGCKEKAWLFFGERNEKTDFYYKEYLLELVAEGSLKLSSAFSRDGDEKRYVQNEMLLNQELLISWFDNGAIFYVCGDAKKMAKDVQKTLTEIYAQHKKISLDKAKKWIITLRKRGKIFTRCLLICQLTLVFVERVEKIDLLSNLNSQLLEHKNLH